MQKTPYQVIDIAQKLKDGLPSSRRFKVRAILKWFGAKRRGDAILAEIQGTLAPESHAAERNYATIGRLHH